MTCWDAVLWLRNRADTYSRDAAVLHNMGMTAEAAMYWTLRDELRRCADTVETEPPIDPADLGTLDDGHGNQWVKCNRVNCGLQIVRPGKVQCDCEYADFEWSETDR